MRGSEGGSSSQPPKSQGGPSKSDESAAAARRRKISVGPIDFAQRRETIKLAYSKSIRDSQAKEARQAAAERRRKELEVVARIKVEAEAATLATAAAAAAAAANSSAVSGQRAASRTWKRRSKRRWRMGRSKSRPILPRRYEPLWNRLRSWTPHSGDSGSFPGAESPRQEEEIPESAVAGCLVRGHRVRTGRAKPSLGQPDGGWYEPTTAIDHDLGISMPGGLRSRSRLLRPAPVLRPATIAKESVLSVPL